MQDRQPGAPGQYILKITVEEVQKLLNSEECVVVLKRDDQPVIEGTPLNKATFLPDELAAKICPDIEDPTPADALEKLNDRIKIVNITLPASGWIGKTQTVNVPGVTSDEDTCHPEPTPDPKSHAMYYDCDVHGIEQLDGKMTFTCDDVPTSDLKLVVKILSKEVTA